LRVVLLHVAELGLAHLAAGGRAGERAAREQQRQRERARAGRSTMEHGSSPLAATPRRRAFGGSAHRARGLSGGRGESRPGARASRYGCASLEGFRIAMRTQPTRSKRPEGTPAEGLGATPLVGVDIGGTKIAVALGEAGGTVRARRRRPTDPSGRPEDDLARIADDVRAVVAEAGLALSDVAAVGVTAPGPLDAEAGVVLLPPNLPGWRNVPIVSALRDALGVPVFLENDANAAALAEWHFGAGRGLRHMVYLTMSTGVGGGLVLDGRLYRGVLGSAGEIGH